jgi:type I restriction enzyme, S subunit
MAKGGKSKATPRLRFPEFRDGSGWTAVPLRELADFVTDQVGTRDCVPYTVTSGIGLVSQQEKLGRTIAGNSIKNYVLLQRNDFAFNKSATKAFPQGYIARYVGDERAAVPNSIFTCFRINEHAILPSYLDYLFSSNLHGRWLRNFTTIGARAHGSLNVNDDDLMALPVPLPAGSNSLKEQQKIADCLASMDEVIAVQRQKVGTLREYKRSLIQELIPSEDETRPRRRFPAFRNAPEWRKAILDQIVDMQSGGTPSKADPSFWTGSIPWVSAKDMKQLFLDDAEDHISTFAVEDGAKLVPAGAVFVLTRGMTLLKDIPICVSRREMSFNQDVKALRPKNDLDGVFLAYLLSRNKQRLLKMVDVAGHGTGKLDSDKLKGLDLMLPKPGEQQQIAECLSAIDLRIYAESERLDALNADKKGLAQRLLPLAGDAL